MKMFVEFYHRHKIHQSMSRVIMKMHTIYLKNRNPRTPIIFRIRGFIVDTAYGGEGSRTPVRKPIGRGLYHHIHYFDIPSTIRLVTGLWLW